MVAKGKSKASKAPKPIPMAHASGLVPEQDPHYLQYHVNIEDRYHVQRIDLKLSKQYFTFASLSEREGRVHPLAQEFSVDEDRMLLFIDMNAMEEETSKRITAKDLARQYSLKRKDDPSAFPKGNISGGILMNRMKELKTTGLRYNVLQQDVLQQLQQIRQEKEGTHAVLDDMAHVKSRKSHSIFNRSSSSLDRSLVPYVKIVVTGRKFDPAYFIVREDKVSSASAYLNTVLRDTHPNSVTGFKEIGLSEHDSEIDTASLFGAYHPDTMKRFVRFAENSDIMDRMTQLQKKFEKLEIDRDQGVSRYVQHLEDRKHELINKTRSSLEGEQTKILTHMKRIRDEALEKIRLMFDAHCFSLSENIDHLVEKRATEIEQFFNKDINDIRELYLRQHEERVEKLQDEIQQHQDEIDRIFPKDSVLPLLILSDMMNAEELRKYCMQTIATHFSHSRKNPAFSSAYLKVDTVKYILASIDTDTLRDMLDNEDYDISKSYVEKEIASRKSALLDEIRYNTTNQLIELQDKTITFPEVLEEELARRRDVVPEVHIDPDLCSQYITLDDKFLSATLNRKNRYALAHATKSRDYNGWGKWYFEICVEKLDRLYGSSICIGWDGPRKSHDDVPHPHLGWQSNGVLYFGESMEYVKEQFQQGDVIGCLLDQDKQNVSWFRNGERVVMFHKISNSKLNEISQVPINNIVYELYPSLVMFTSRMNAQCSVRCQFAKPFAHGIPVPYTAPYADSKKRKSQ